MKRCGTELNNPEYLKLADAAEVKARSSDINDKTKGLENRINQIEVLEKFFPIDAKVGEPRCRQHKHCLGKQGKEDVVGPDDG